MNSSLLLFVLSLIGLLAIPATFVLVHAELVDDIPGTWLLLAIGVMNATIVTIWLMVPADVYRRLAAGVAVLSLLALIAIYSAFLYQRNLARTEAYEILRRHVEQLD